MSPTNIQKNKLYEEYPKKTFICPESTTEKLKKVEKYVQS